MSDLWADVIRRVAAPLEPVPTDVEPRVQRLEGIRAVLFDVYGTLFMSVAGDAAAEPGAREGAFEQALAAVGIPLIGKPQAGVAALDASIEEARAALRERGVDHPEVDIVAMWRATVQRLVREAVIEAPPEDLDASRLAVEFEARTHPVWPAPGLEACLDGLRAADLAIGLVSNSQFYTEELFPAFTGRSLEDLGIPVDLRCLSFRHARAKPSQFLFDQAVAALRKRGIKPEAVLFVGHDMLFDIKPAAAVGFHTAMFAGDARSYAPRPRERAVKGVAPDVVITALVQVLDCVLPA